MTKLDIETYELKDLIVLAETYRTLVSKTERQITFMSATQKEYAEVVDNCIAEMKSRVTADNNSPISERDAFMLFVHNALPGERMPFYAVLDEKLKGKKRKPLLAVSYDTEDCGLNMLEEQSHAELMPPPPTEVNTTTWRFTLASGYTLDRERKKIMFNSDEYLQAKFKDHCGLSKDMILWDRLAGHLELSAFEAGLISHHMADEEKKGKRPGLTVPCHNSPLHLGIKIGLDFAELYVGAKDVKAYLADTFKKKDLYPTLLDKLI